MNKLAIDGGTPVRRKSEFLVFGSPRLGEEEVREVVAVLRGGWIGSGPVTEAFEREFSEFKDRAIAVALNSCTAGLHLALLALGIGRGDEVITTAMTFCATVNAIIHAGATPVLVDCDSADQCLDTTQIDSRVTNRTAAVLPVHIAGNCCDMDAIKRIAGKHGLHVIEDCAHSVEAEFQQRKSGTMGDVGVFSFHATKNLTTADGGMAITKDSVVAEKIRVLAQNGLSRGAWDRRNAAGFTNYDVLQPGFKYRMTDVQAAIGIQQLRKLETHWQRRKEIWEQYLEAFSDLPCALPRAPRKGSKHGYHLFSILVDSEATGKSRDWVANALLAENIGVGVHYLPLHAFSYYRAAFGWDKVQFPVAESIGSRTLSLPLSPYLSRGDVDDVIRAVRKVFRARAA